MEFSRLFLFPREFQTVIEILEYLFCKMLCDPCLVMEAEGLRIEPTNKPRRHLFWRAGKDILYAPYPGWWKIHCESRSHWPHCPYRPDHEMVRLFRYIGTACDDRAGRHHGFRKLQGIFQILEKEYAFTGCFYCSQLDKEIKELGYPTDLVVDYYTGWKEEEGSVESLREILKPHIDYCGMLMGQTRSAIIRRDVLQVLSLIYQNHRMEYESAVLRHADLRLCYEKFSRDIQSALLERVPFLSLKNIDFKAWFRSLFFFQLELRDLSHPETDKRMLFCKKVLFLLYYLFPEEIPESEDLEEFPTCFVIENGKKSMRVTIPGKKLYEYHPMIRGNAALHATSV